MTPWSKLYTPRYRDRWTVRGSRRGHPVYVAQMLRIGWNVLSPSTLVRFEARELPTLLYNRLRLVRYCSIVLRRVDSRTLPPTASAMRPRLRDIDHEREPSPQPRSR